MWGTSRARSRHAFTIVECLVVIAVVTVLTSIAIPAVSKARIRGVQAVCTGNMHSCGQLLETYSSANREYLPFGGFELRWLETPDVGSGKVGIGHNFGLGFGAWAFLFPDEWSGARWSRGLCCPYQPEYDRSSAPDSFEGQPGPLYFMSSAVWLDEKCFPSNAAEASVWVPKPHKAADVVYPSSKGYLIENPAFCADGPTAQQDIYGNRLTFVEPASLLLFDGSASRKAMRDMRRHQGRLPVISTEDGIAGRDL